MFKIKQISPSTNILLLAGLKINLLPHSLFMINSASCAMITPMRKAMFCIAVKDLKQYNIMRTDEYPKLIGM